MFIKCSFCKKKIELPKLADAHLAAVWEVLEKHNWIRMRAAKDLGVSERTMRAWIAKWKELGIDIPESEYQRERQGIGITLTKKERPIEKKTKGTAAT